MNRRDTPLSKGHLNPETSTPVARYPASPDLAGLVRFHWVPEWSLPEGQAVTARVLGYPSLNLVVEADAVLVSGPTRAASERVLRGTGWAVGTLLQPAATIALRYDAADLLDSVVPLDEPDLAGRVVAAMTAAGPAPSRHRRAVAVVEEWLRARLGPPTEQGALANEAVALVEGDPSVTRVAVVAERLHVTPRTLQRAVRRCTGLSPHEVIRRRRLQEVADRLRTGAGEDLARVAAETGYADHAHLTRDFRESVRQTPSDFRRTR